MGCAPYRRWISFFFQAEDGIRDLTVTGVQTCALPILFWNGHQQVQSVSGGGGFCSQNQRRLHFGVGKNPQIEKAEIRWPSGKIETIARPSAGQVYKIKEAA